MPRTSAFVVALLALSHVAPVAHASQFRGSGPVVAMGRMSAQELRATMLDELMEALGSGNRVTEQRLSKIEEALNATFLSMPKNSYGNLEHGSVRYVLHRLFVQRHGMYVKGLEPSGQTWNGTSPTDVLEDKVPAYVQALFEERLSGRGLGMHEIAILAATLEHLVHNEAVERLRAAYQAHGWSFEGRLGNAQVSAAIDTYMVLFILGQNVSALTPAIVKESISSIEAIYPAWPASQKFARMVKQDVADKNDGNSAFMDGQLEFSATTLVVEEIGERYGRWQDAECQDLKKALMKMEDASTGRVQLKEFYGNALDGAWQFTESVEYLRDLGALDETDPSRKSVIISNYINAPSNCLASSGIYSICCLNECEPLLGHIEKAVGAPEVEPTKLMDIVTNLPSATVDAPRALSATMRNLLVEVAGHHGGLVPIHGRLFSQWMHHAYPRECPYPHKAGTTSPLTAEEWMNERNASAVAGTADLQRHVEEFEEHFRAAESNTAGSPSNAATVGASPVEKPFMWTAEEELIATTRGPTTGLLAGWSSVFRNVAIFALLSSAGVSVKHLLESPSSKQSMLPLRGKQHFC